MKLINYSSVFEENCDYICSNVLNAIKDAFIVYYGEENKGKIERVFSELRVAFICDNLPKRNIKKILEDMSFLDYSNMNKYRLRHMQIRSGMYYMAYKNRKYTPYRNVIVYSSDKSGKTYEEDKYVERSFQDEGCFMKNSDNTLVYIRLDQNGKLKLHYLIHEIQHALVKEKLCETDNSIVSVTGVFGGININKPSLIVDELLNEYICKDVMERLQDKADYNWLFVDLSFTSSYLNLDYMHNNLVERIYKLLVEEIKKNMINGNCNVIKRIINAYRASTFDLICRGYDKLNVELERETDDGRFPINTIFAKVKNKKKKDNVGMDDLLYAKTKLGYKKYKEDIEKQDRLIDRLVLEGKAKRLKKIC